MIIRSFGNGFEVQDWTEELNIIPNQWGTIQDLGIFTDEPVFEQSVVFEEIKKDGALIVDRVRGERSNVNKDYTRKLHSFIVPHFPLDDAIYPQDLQGKRAYGSATEAENLAAVRSRKMERIMQDHSWTLEAARAQALTLGTAYAPNGTVNQNWFSEFAKVQTVVDFAFGDASGDMISHIESVIATIMDIGGSVQMTGVVGLCSPTFFASLIRHPSVKVAYQFYQSTQSPLRDRLAAGGSSTVMHRNFVFAGINFIEMRDAYNGVPLIPIGTATFVPTGTDYFKTYFAPAQRFGLVNTLGEKAYMFETAALNGTSIILETESNHISALLRPELVIKGFSSN